MPDRLNIPQIIVGGEGFPHKIFAVYVILLLFSFMSEMRLFWYFQYGVSQVQVDECVKIVKKASIYCFHCVI